MIEAAIITTYRCMSKCRMCNIWRNQTTEEEEFKPSLLEKLPPLSFCNITGGEPFLRDDIDEIISILARKSKRVVVSTNGFLVQRILDSARRHPDIGFRVSMEGLPAANDELRGQQHGFDHGLRVLLELGKMGVKDIGFGITVSDRNAKDMLELYHLSRLMKVEFATAVVHNSYYFHKYDNEIQDKSMVVECFNELIQELLGTWKIKNWFRAYFNHGLIEYIHDRPRLLPCSAGTDFFFLDPAGHVRPCNGMDENSWFESMGNLHESSFKKIWLSENASATRKMVRNCERNCWMIGSASPAIKRNLPHVAAWAIRHKIQTIFKRAI